MTLSNVVFSFALYWNMNVIIPHLSQLLAEDWSKHCESADLLVPQVRRPKKSELSGWQKSARKNFPDEVRKSFFATNKVRKSFRDKKTHKIAI